jgi:hypothetical protein
MMGRRHSPCVEFCLLVAVSAILCRQPSKTKYNKRSSSNSKSNNKDKGIDNPSHQEQQKKEREEKQRIFEN